MDKEASASDVRQQLFSGVIDRTVVSAIRTKRSGVIAGIDAALAAAGELGMTAMSNVRDGMPVAANETILMLSGDPCATARAEESLIGLIAKASGVATAAREAADAAGGRFKVVSGSIKKIPGEIRHALRQAVVGGGVQIRICTDPFIYLDKNYLRIFGSLESALAAARDIPGRKIVVQLRGEHGAVAEEALEACCAGADILMIDTGDRRHIQEASRRLREQGLRDSVRLAFAGDVRIGEIPMFYDEDIDILCIGRDILDAPLLDLSFDVLETAAPEREGQFKMNLLDKSELFIENVVISSVNLNTVAEKVSAALGIDRSSVLVVDVRPTHITLDLLCGELDALEIAGKERRILLSLSEIDGFETSEDSYIHSNGVLGLISLDEDCARQVVEDTVRVGREIRANIAKRACVFPTGFELQAGMIEDTNSPYIAEKLRELGYEATIMPCVPDDQTCIRNALEDAISRGYTLIVTSGGVGAEDKDKTVEAVLELDPGAAAPWLVKYQKGSGRHLKSGIRIAVAELNDVKIVTFPGPNDEVRLGMDALLDCIKSGGDKYAIAQSIASVLRTKLQKTYYKHEH